MFRSAILLTALLVAASASDTPAAPVPIGPKADDTVPYTTAKLLKYRKVQKEVKMTAEQRVNVLDGLEDVEEEHEKQLVALDKLPNAPDEAFQKVEKDRLKALEKLLTTSEKTLTPAQRTRLRQVGWQMFGPATFADPHVQKALQLSDDEKKAAAALAEQAKEKAQLYLQSLGNEDEEKVKAEVLGSRKEAVKKFTTLLTAEQRDAWKAMLGDPVKSFDADELWLKFIEDEDADLLD
jgi:hypothetical protein